MTSAWFLGAQHSVPQRESEVRSTVEPIRTDGPPEATGDPDFNEVETDNSGELVGLSPREVAPDTHDSEQYLPWWAALASYPHNILIDKQVSSSGTAAAREEKGEQGHGTMQYAVALEPVIRDGAQFGNDYFAAHPAVIQEGAGDYMTPDVAAQQGWSNAIAAANAEAASRRAYAGTLYAEFMG